MRVSELANELGKTSKEVLDIINGAGTQPGGDLYQRQQPFGHRYHSAQSGEENDAGRKVQQALHGAFGGSGQRFTRRQGRGRRYFFGSGRVAEGNSHRRHR